MELLVLVLIGLVIVAVIKKVHRIVVGLLTLGIVLVLSLFIMEDMWHLPVREYVDVSTIDKMENDPGGFIGDTSEKVGKEGKKLWEEGKKDGEGIVEDVREGIEGHQENDYVEEEGVTDQEKDSGDIESVKGQESDSEGEEVIVGQEIESKNSEEDGDQIRDSSFNGKEYVLSFGEDRDNFIKEHEVNIEGEGFARKVKGMTPTVGLSYEFDNALLNSNGSEIVLTYKQE